MRTEREKEEQKISIRKRKGMKRTLLILSVLATALMVFAGCKKEPKVEEITSVKVDPVSVVMSIGETKQLTVTTQPEGLKATPIFTSDNAKVATVSDKGVITAIAEGKAVVTVTVGALKATCDVTVAKRGAAGKSQLPAMCFNSGDNHPIIQAHEKASGRTFQEKVLIEIVRGEQYSHGAFVNDELDIFPVVCYGLSLDGNDVVTALGKESIDDCAATIAMLKGNGFPDVNLMEEDGKTFIFGHSKDGLITVLGRESEILDVEGQPDTKILVDFMRPAGLPIKWHDCVATAKDFPSWDAFITKDKEKIVTFEDELGLREYNEGYSEPSENNFDYETITEKGAETNLDWVYYCVTPSQDGVKPYINAGLNFVDGTGQLGSEVVKNWLATNGYDTDYQKNGEEEYLAFNKDKSAVARVFVKGTTAKLQIVDASILKSAAMAMRMKELAFDPRYGELQHYRSLKLRAKR